MGVIHQLCYNHGFHLAVVDVVFKKAATNAQTAESESNPTNYDLICDDENSDTDTDSESINDDDDEYEDEDDSDADDNENIRPDIKNSLKKVRAMIRTFKASPIKNSVLQNHVKAKLGKELSLLLDCRTRWSSTEVMLARFISLYDSIILALADINSTEQLGDDEIALLKDLMNALEPLKLAVNELSKRDSNLLTCEGVLVFTLKELKAQDSEIARELYTALKMRILQRRNTDLVSVLKYLKSKDLTSTELPMLSKKNVHKTIVDLIIKYFPIASHTEIEEEVPEYIKRAA